MREVLEAVRDDATADPELRIRAALAVCDVNARRRYTFRASRAVLAILGPDATNEKNGVAVG